MAFSFSQFVTETQEKIATKKPNPVEGLTPQRVGELVKAKILRLRKFNPEKSITPESIDASQHVLNPEGVPVRYIGTGYRVFRVSKDGTTCSTCGAVLGHGAFARFAKRYDANPNGGWVYKSTEIEGCECHPKPEA